MFLLEIGIFLIITFVVLRPLYMGYFYTRPPRIKISFFTPTSLGVTYDEVSLTMADGVVLDGWYVPSRNGAAVIMLHGHSANRLAVLPPAEALIRAGYGVLMFDLRAHGLSGGKRFARSEVLVEDVQTAVAFLSKRPEVNAAGIGLFGVSIGGTVALHAAARTVAIRAVAVDGPSPASFADMPPPATFLQRWLHWPLQKYYMWAADFFARGTPLGSTKDVLRQLKPRPLLFVAVGDGAIARMGQQFALAAPQPNQLWAISSGRHTTGWSARPEAYAAYLIRFFDFALVSQRHGETAVFPEPPAAPARQTAVDGYEVVEDASISMLWANVVALLMLPLAALFFFVPYRWIWGEGVLQRSLTLDWPTIGLIVAIFLASIVAHEWLHAVGFRQVGGVPSTAVRYGFSWQGLAPYAHCNVPMPARAYRISVVLPGVLLGIVPGLVGVAAGLWWLTLWALMMVMAAGGDTAVLLAMRHVSGDALVIDHPEKAGCYVVQPREK